MTSEGSAEGLLWINVSHSGSSTKVGSCLPKRTKGLRLRSATH